MEKVLGGTEGVITILVQQPDGESTFLLPSSAFVTKDRVKILVGQVIPMGKLIFIPGTWNRANK